MQLTWTSVDGESLTLDNSNQDANYLIQDYSGLGSPEASVVEQKSPFQDGSTLANVQLAPRDLRLVIGVRATTQSELETKIRGLARLFSPVGMNRQQNIGTLLVTAAYGSSYTLYAYAGGVQPANGNYPLIKFWTVTLRAYDPVFYGTVQSVNFAVNVSAQAVNDGDLSCLPYIDIIGPCNSPSLENETTGKTIGVSGDVASGYKLRLDHRFGYKKVTYINISTEAEVDWFQYLDTGFIFWDLIADTNNFLLTSDDNQGTGVLYFQKNYLAVA
jgi:hypothetical protein